MKMKSIERKIKGGAGTILLLALSWLSGCKGNQTVPSVPHATFNNNEIVVAAPAVTRTLQVNSSRAWKIEVIDNSNRIDGQEWCTISPTSGDAGRTDVVVTVAESSPEANARVAKFQLSSGAAGDVLTVIQTGIPLLTVSTPTGIDDVSATFAGQWIYALGNEVIKTGFQYKKATDTGWTTVMLEDRVIDPYADPVVTQQNFSYKIPRELVANTLYEVRAIITLENGKTYESATVEFSTLATPRLVTIAEFRTRYNNQDYTITDAVKIRGIVISDSLGNNFPTRNMFVLVDAEHPNDPNSGIVVFLSDVNANITKSPFTTGDCIEVKLPEAVLTKLSAEEPVLAVKVSSAKLTKYPNSSASVTPVTIAQVDFGKYESMLVSIENTQVTPPFANNSTKYRYWYNSGSQAFSMEVEGSEATYELAVSDKAKFAGQEAKIGSGTVTGIVSRNNKGFAVRPRNATDLSLLTRDRFASLLNLKITKVEFSGSMVINTANANCNLRISYVNGISGEMLPEISVSIAGAGAPGLNVNPKTGQLTDDGSGSFTLAVTGIPTAEGDVTFTVSGLETYGLSGASAVCAAKVTTGIPTGNFMAIWNNFTTNSNNANKAPLNSNSNSQPDVIVGPVNAVGFIAGVNYNNAYGGGGFNDKNNNTASPDVYATVKVTNSSSSQKLSLYEFYMRIRKNDVGAKTTVLQYSLNDGAYVDIKTYATPNPTGNSTDIYRENLSLIPELQNLATGASVTFRMIPQGSTSATGTWALSNQNSITALSIGGNLE